jgi:acetyl esterase/lipase
MIAALLAGLICFYASTTQACGGDEKKPTRISDVIYGRKDGLALTLDVFPPTGKSNETAVVLIASGGFKSSAAQIQPMFTAEFVKRGYTCFVIVHGSQPRYTVPEIRDDCNRAVRFIRHNAKKYQIDPQRIGAGGLSSGGVLALLLGTAPQPANANAEDPVDRMDSGVQAVAAFFPPTDYLNYGVQGKDFMDIKTHAVDFRAAHEFRDFDAMEGLYRVVTDKTRLREIYRDISPIYHVTRKTAPTLLIHGDKDKLVPLQQSESFHAKLQKEGVPTKLDVRKGAGHGWLTILNDLPTVANWFDAYLLKKPGGNGKR